MSRSDGGCQAQTNQQIVDGWGLPMTGIVDFQKIVINVGEGVWDYVCSMIQACDNCADVQYTLPFWFVQHPLLPSEHVG